MKRILSAMILSLAAACGGSAEPAPAQPTPTADPAGGTMPAGEQHEHKFPAEVDAFHERLKPLWHAEAGAKRTEDTCASAADLLGEAGPMSDGTPFPGDDAKATAYNTAVGELKTAIIGLQEACGVEGRPDFDAAFTKVHEAFHKVVAFFGHTEHPDEPDAAHAHE